MRASDRAAAIPGLKGRIKAAVLDGNTDATSLSLTLGVTRDRVLQFFTVLRREGVAIPHSRVGRRAGVTMESYLRPEDFIPCARCGLRGHVAGDPDRCLRGNATAGMGQWTGASAQASGDGRAWSGIR